MDIFRCTVCGYLYEPQNGDPTREISGGTPFEDLPMGWVCPVCGAPKDMFAPVAAGGPEVVQGFFL
jgi:rubredoxin